MPINRLPFSMLSDKSPVSVDNTVAPIKFNTTNRTCTYNSASPAIMKLASKRPGPGDPTNLLDSTVWTIGNSGSVGQFEANGQVSENTIVSGTGPYGNTVALWQGGNDNTSDADGGWNSSYFTIDPTKDYRLTVWMRANSISALSNYFGTQNVRTLAGSDFENPYFWYGVLPAANTWYLLVAYIRSVDYEGYNSKGGMYSGVNGSLIVPFVGTGNLGGDARIRTSVTSFNHRTYMYYTTDTSHRTWWWDPRVEVCDGSEPSIDDLLSHI